MRREVRIQSDIIYALWLKEKKTKKNFTLFYSHYTYRINFRQLIRGHLNCLLPATFLFASPPMRLMATQSFLGDLLY